MPNKQQSKNNHEQHPSNFKEIQVGVDEEDSIGLDSHPSREGEGGDGENSSAYMDDLSGYNSVNKTAASSDDGITLHKDLSEVESQKVFRLRMIVIGVLILTALAVSAAVFKITVQGEVDEFETQYEGAASKVIDSFEEIMNKMGSVAGLGVSFTSHAQHKTTTTGDDRVVINSSWPFVTLEDFPLRARNVLQLSGALMVGMSPVLSGSLFEPWDDYVDNPAQQLWIAESLGYQEAQGFQNPKAAVDHSSLQEDRVVDVMHYYNGSTVLPEIPGHDWYLPMWQVSPYVRKGLVNNNLLRYENTTQSVRRVYQRSSAVLGGMILAPPGPMDSPDPETALLATLRSAQADTDTDYLGDPMTDFFIPMFDGFDGARRNVVGVLNALIHWKSYFRKVLPDNMQGIVVVLEYDCKSDNSTSTTASGAPVREEEDAAQRRQRRRTAEETTTKEKSSAAAIKKRDLQTTFSIIEVSDFEEITDAPSATATTSYWNAQAHRTPEPTTSYWNAQAHRTPEPTTSYWNAATHSTTTPEPTPDSTTSYWNVAAHRPSTPAPTTSYWNVDAHSSSTPATSAPTTSYWNADAHTLPPAPSPTTTTTTTTTTANPNAEETTTTNVPTLAPFATEETQHQSQTMDTSSGDGGENENEEEEEVGSFFTYIIEGTEAHVLGVGDLHDPTFDEFMRRGSFATQTLKDGTVNGIPIDQQCSYNLYVYPSQTFYEGYITSTPITITLVVVAVFIFAIITFLFYNRMVERRQRRILKKANQSTAIVSSLFPKNVRDRLLAGGPVESLGSRLDLQTKSRLKGFMAGENNDNDAEAAPIADLFPHCTVFFADIAGFTAWSSTREPSQVFILLQTVYQAFDQLAKRRRVFKVETIGDCYMAVTGLPDPQDSHASIMVRFAYDCITKMREVTKHLESQLGPDTTELSMRIGLHSGPVTAGVLRGDRARFQLFGDTVNTASRMESTGIRGKIQVSEATAKILQEHGRGHWLFPRADAVKAKGKGVLKTFWANPKMRNNSNSWSWDAGSSDQDEEETSESTDDDGSTVLQQAQIRLVDWIVKLMSDDIRKIIYARHKGTKISKKAPAPAYIPPDGSTCMDEVKEVIHMPKFDSKKSHNDDYKKIRIDDDMTRELGEYVTGVAKLYRQNPFHNFEHACHVTMSVNKLIRRIVSPELSADQVDGFDNASENKIAAHLHDYTYGINSDPLAMFAMTFSALIHDVDHRGVSNMQLATEEPNMASKYHKKSIAEQNSLDLAWDLLMEDRFADLRKYLFVSEEELLRFRQLIVNIVLATDIFDKELNDLRKNRWKRAFSGEEETEDIHQSDLRATIVIEHIIQASDVSHTMQHWHVYQKWNKCLFREMHSAFRAGRLGKDPATFWYKGEIGFFDNYIIPLAKKLKDCGVFGVSSDEYLNYAQQNRAEWEERGQDIVAALVEEVNKAGAGSTPAPVTRPAKKRLSTGSKQRSNRGLDASVKRQASPGA